MTKEEGRAVKWDSEVILCKKCNTRRVKRNCFVRAGYYRCSKCVKLSGKTARTLRWDSTFVSCSLHTERRCNRSDFVTKGMRRCGSCGNRKGRVGEYQDHYIRYMQSEQRYWRQKSTALANEIRNNRI